MVALQVAALYLPCAALGASPPPWELWHDLRTLAVIHDGDQVLLRSSHCPAGCRYDRHSADDWRYLRVDGDEGVIFEEAGAGAITRIWMTQGAGTSVAISSSIRLRIYVDRSATPIVDLPLAALFDGSSPPFVPPLVGDRLTSSGGNFSYVPIPYRDGCRVSLSGADDETIWFQLSFHRLSSPAGITSFTGLEDLSGLGALLSCRGDDPWLLGAGLPASSRVVSGTRELDPGHSVRLVELDGPDLLTALRLDLPPRAWRELQLTVVFDGEVRAAMSAADFFAVGRRGADSTRSLLSGVSAEGTLYSYFPMPFSASAELYLALPADATSPLAVGWSVRHWGAAPLAGSGVFTAQLHHSPATPVGADIPLLQLDGRGRWVGLFAELASISTLNREYLEGDERVYIDGSPHPSVHGTGTEDFFNGGFYFDQGDFQQALHGSPYHIVENGEDTTAMYRIMLSDGPTWTSSVRAGLEGGPTGDLSLRARTVAFAYHDPTPALWRWDVLDLGDATSRERHAYTTHSAHELRPLDSSFEGAAPQSLQATGIYRAPGSASFVLRSDGETRTVRLRRRFDAGLPWQAAELFADGTSVAGIPPVPVNSHHRWRDMDVDFPAPVGDGTPLRTLLIEVLASPNPDGESAALGFSEFLWELWAATNPQIFSDDLECGTTSQWSSTAP